MDFLFGKNAKRGEGKAMPKDLEPFKRFYIVEFHYNSFKFGQNVQGGGFRGLPKILEQFHWTFDHFRLFKVLEERTVFKSLIHFQKPTK